ncbi:hypothetical protein AB0K34_07215 [Actinomadura sp. NPDC049382]|uniref:hypothetical protein n=1 Tax=Actinomadura sp. NPDC049382 TaxID=3158220 RepID=UPI00343B2B2B
MGEAIGQVLSYGVGVALSPFPIIGVMRWTPARTRLVEGTVSRRSSTVSTFSRVTPPGRKDAP